MKDLFLVQDPQENSWRRKQLLESAGFEVTLFASGEELLERLSVQRPDLVLMDVLLEGRNGFQICRQIRLRWKPHEVPVLLTTSVYRHERYRKEALESGASDLLLEPVGLAELTSRIQACLGGETPRPSAAPPAERELSQ